MDFKILVRVIYAGIWAELERERKLKRRAE